MDYQPWSLLQIDGQKILDRHAKNIRCQYRWIEAGGEIVRLASGELRSLRRSQFRKLAVTISGEAVRKPPLDLYHRGDIVTIDCPAHLDLKGDVADVDLPRTAVPGSIYRFGEQLADGSPYKRPILLEHGDAGVMITAFRPRITVMLFDIDVEADEQNASCRWSISGEEV